MSVTETHAPGTFCWIELVAHDENAARDFYTRFFGWEAEDSKYGEGDGDIYTMLKLGGRNAGAVFGMSPDMRAGGVPSHWGVYVAVASADQAAEKAAALGGTVVMPPFDVLDVGRMSVIQDPTGATFSVWEGRRHPGVGVRDEPGSLVWCELATPDTERAQAFYSALFGWGSQTENVGMEYTSFLNGGTPVGGMYRITEQMGPMPPAWAPYFGVDDADDAARRARELGATVVVPPTDIPGVGRFAMITDPQGAMFNVIRLTQPA